MTKRPAATDEPTGNLPKVPKRLKLNVRPRAEVKAAKKPVKQTKLKKSSHPHTAISSTSTSQEVQASAGLQIPNMEGPEYTAEQVFWIRFHYAQLLFATENRSAVACKGTTSCAYFNAYFEGHTVEGLDPNETSDTVDLQAPLAKQTRSRLATSATLPSTYTKRAFKDFHAKTQQILDITLGQIEESSTKNKDLEDAKEFRPIIAPALLESFITLFREHSTNGELNYGNSLTCTKINTFLTPIIDQQLAPTESPWIAAGTHNILSRAPISLANYTARHIDELDSPPSAVRRVWHQDNTSHPHASQSITLPYGATDAPEQFRLTYRKPHAATGNALLNMALLRPAGFDGDLNDLVKGVGDVQVGGMDERKEKEWEEQLQAARAGEELRRRVFGDAVWPPKEMGTDLAARVTTGKVMGGEVDGEVDEDGDVVMEG